jgi:hypothetical protein
MLGAQAVLTISGGTAPGTSGVIRNARLELTAEMVNQVFPSFRGFVGSPPARGVRIPIAISDGATPEQTARELAQWFTARNIGARASGANVIFGVGLNALKGPNQNAATALAKSQAIETHEGKLFDRTLLPQAQGKVQAPALRVIQMLDEQGAFAQGPAKVFECLDALANVAPVAPAPPTRAQPVMPGDHAGSPMSSKLTADGWVEVNFGSPGLIKAFSIKDEQSSDPLAPDKMGSVIFTPRADARGEATEFGTYRFIVESQARGPVSRTDAFTVTTGPKGTRLDVDRGDDGCYSCHRGNVVSPMGSGDEFVQRVKTDRSLAVLNPDSAPSLADMSTLSSMAARLGAMHLATQPEATDSIRFRQEVVRRALRGGVASPEDQDDVIANVAAQVASAQGKNKMAVDMVDASTELHKTYGAIAYEPVSKSSRAASARAMNMALSLPVGFWPEAQPYVPGLLRPGGEAWQAVTRQVWAGRTVEDFLNSQALLDALSAHWPVTDADLVGAANRFGQDKTPGDFAEAERRSKGRRRP